MKKELPTEYKMYSLSDLEGMLGLSRRSLFNYIKNKTLPAVKIGGKWMVRETDLKMFIGLHS